MSAHQLPHPAPQKLKEEEAEEEVWEDQRRKRLPTGSGKLSASSASSRLSNVSSKQAQQQHVLQHAQEEQVGSGNVSGVQGMARGVAIVVSNS